MTRPLLDPSPVMHTVTTDRCCLPDAVPLLAAGDAERIAQDLQMFAHPVRLQILGLLARQAGQVCVCDIEAALPVKQPTTSHHLKLLREAGLIDCERRGLWAYYFIKHDELRTRWSAIQQALAPIL